MKISELPPRIRKIALKEQMKGHRIQDENIELAKAFSWAGTKEGHLFWKAINDGDFSGMPDYKETIPEYWCIRMDDKNPLWKKFLAWANKEKNAGYDVHDLTTFLYFGFDGTWNASISPKEFRIPVKLITLEQWDEAVFSNAQIYTISDLAAGKVICINDGTQEELNKVLKAAFPDDGTGLTRFFLKHRFFCAGELRPEVWSPADGRIRDKVKPYVDLPKQSVKVFAEELARKTIKEVGGVLVEAARITPYGLSEIKINGKQLSEYTIYPKPDKWQPQYGDRVQMRDSVNDEWEDGIFIGMNPDANEETYKYVILISNNVRKGGGAYAQIRQPFTLSRKEIADKFNIALPDLKIVD